MRNSKPGKSWELLDSWDDIARFRSAWAELQTHPNADMEFFKMVLSSLDGSPKPFVSIARSGERVTSMFLGRRETGKLPLRLGYFNLPSPPLSILRILYGGVLGNPDQNEIQGHLRQLRRQLSRKTADLVMLEYVNADSLLAQEVKKASFPFLNDRWPRKFTHCRLRITRDPGSFWAILKKKHSYNLRRLLKSLDKDFPGMVTYRFFSRNEDLPALMGDAEVIAQKTYQRAIGVGFDPKSRLIRNRLEHAANKGWLRAHILYLEGQPAAYWMGTLYRDTFYLDFTGFDPAFRRYEPGTVLLVKMIEGLCLETTATSVDFNFGDAHYKHHFSNEKWTEATLVIFPLSLHGIALCFLKGMTDGVFHLGTWIATKLKAKDTLRRKLRGLAKIKHGKDDIATGDSKPVRDPTTPSPHPRPKPPFVPPTTEKGKPDA